jgi:hypothetical protein
MDHNTTSREARSLGWTREQVAFLADRLRNALTVLSAPNVAADLRKQAADKMLFTMEAIENAAFRVKPGKARFIHSSPPAVPRSRRGSRKPKKPGRG